MSTNDLLVLASDFEFKDQRTYVHGSSLVEGAWKAAVSAQIGRWVRPRADATFIKPVTTNGHFHLATTKSGLPPADSLAAWFRISEGNESLWVGFVADETVTVNRRVATGRRIVNLTAVGPFAGHCLIGVSSTAELLENLIEANKQIHLTTVAATGVPAVVNAYMRGVPLLPVDGIHETAVAIANLAVRQAGAVTTTLNQITCPALQTDAFEIAYLLRFAEVK